MASTLHEWPSRQLGIFVSQATPTKLCFAVVAAVLGLLVLSYHRKSQRRIAERELFDRYTAVPDLGVLLPRPRRRFVGTAVIVGGSITGLLAARVCADHFERVVIVEPDVGADTSFPAAGGEGDDGTRVKRDDYGNASFSTRRPRVPQTFSIHFYQPYALLALRRLFPSFDETFTSLGGRISALTRNSVWSGVKLPTSASAFPSHQQGKGLPQHPHLKDAYRAYNDDDVEESSLPYSMWCTRANLEVWIRKLILNMYPGIDIIKGTVTALEKSERTNSITGVVYHPTTGIDRSGKTLKASLVVDCTGHSKAGVKWLERLGYDPIPQETYDPGLCYATKWFETHRDSSLPIPANLKELELPLYAWEDASMGRKMVWASRNDHGAIALSFGGYGYSSSDMPRTADELKEFYRTMKTFDGSPMDEWYIDLIDLLTKDDGWERAKFESMRVPANVYVKYHDLPLGSLPNNFVALGDAVMRSSPVYGLGVTKGIVGAVTLAGALDRAGRAKGAAMTPKGKLAGVPIDFAWDVLQRQHERTGWLWQQAKESDYGHDTTVPCQGETLEVGATNREVVKELFRLSTHDEDAAATFYYLRLWMHPYTAPLFRHTLKRCLDAVNARAKAKS